ncbi:universal stress protein [Planctomonas psychrotolerans]|uniref:universal stress protein n=1 Tax=Planctomonas psychrotolerans TaxID=2528712 RepID=UPI001D0D1E76|nr:universal stress protein [Planctomonas psychrotolerans]
MADNAVSAERVVVAVNGGPESDAALEWVIDRARTRSLEVDVTTVVELGWSPAAGTVQEMLPAYESVLTKAVKRVQKEAPTAVTTGFVRRGVPRFELLNAASRADLLVVGTHEPTGVFHGFLPHQLASAARCTIVVVAAKWTPPNGPVVVGAHDDETSQVALDFAAREAMHRGSELVVMHAWRVPAVLALGRLGGRDPHVRVQTAHQDILDRCVTRIQTEYPDLRIRPVLEEGPPAQCLVDIAEQADLVVVGTHRHGAVPGLLLGSVAHDVLVNMPCPVAVVPHPDAPEHD